MYLGLDLGTTALKCVLVDSDFTIVASASKRIKTRNPEPGWSEQDPQDWWAAVGQGLSELRSQHASAFASVKAIGLSGQMHGAVLLDDAAQVIRPAILWNDSRATDICKALETLPGDLPKIAGVGPMPGFTAPKVAWMKQHEPGLYRRIATVFLPKDYLGFRLHGSFVTDPSDAAGTWWFDQSARDWSDALCAATETNPDWLPAPHPGSAVAGTLHSDVAEELGLPAGIPVSVGAGDAAAAAVAMGAVRAGQGFISLGTSGQLFVGADTHVAPQNTTVHAFAHTLDQTWFQMAAMLNGARPLDWFANVSDCDVPTLLEEASETDERRLPMFLPYLTGERTPHGDARIRGAFYGLSDDTTRGQMARAIIEAIAYSFADARDVFSRRLDMPETLLVVGGGARSDLLLQTVADATGLALARSAGADLGPAVGACKLAAMGLGAISRADLLPPPEGQRFDPDPDALARHRARHDTYRLFYRQMQPVRDALSAQS